MQYQHITQNSFNFKCTNSNSHSTAVAMGIQGLLPLLKSIMDNIHVKEYAHKKVAIDGYAW